jgi:hypothetical protein
MKLLSTITALVLVSSASAAESKRAPLPPAYVEECGSCHVAFPGRMLDAASWQAVLGGLAQHFGVDASTDPSTLEPIRAYLESSARRKPTVGADGKPLLRITETRWFVHEHDEVPSRLRPGGAEAVKPADCGACHQQAATGSYAERDIRMPPKGATR